MSALHHKHAYLDSLRWVAAFCVGMSHAFNSFYTTQSLQIGHVLGTAIFNGSYAVVFFFVLSGFVLVNATQSLSFGSYTGFVARRILRIYPAAWLSLILAACTVGLVSLLPTYGSPWMSSWANDLLQVPSMTLRSMVEEFSLATHRTNPILWSIAVEMVASMLYPLMIFVMRRSIPVYAAMCLCAMLVSALVPSDLSLATSGHYLYMFMIGAALNLLRPGFISTKRGGYLLICAMVLMLLGRPLWFTTADFLFTLSAAMVIAVVAFACPAPVQAVLGHRIFLLLGRCSYSYYLLNPAVMIVLVSLYPMLGIGPPFTLVDYTIYALVLGVAAALCTTPLAHLMAISVERLSIKIGRNVERAIVATRVPHAVA